VIRSAFIGISPFSFLKRNSKNNRKKNNSIPCRKIDRIYLLIDYKCKKHYPIRKKEKRFNFAGFCLSTCEEKYKNSVDADSFALPISELTAGVFRVKIRYVAFLRRANTT